MSTLHKDHRDILIAPVVSEKSYGLLDEGKYTFIVAPDANKVQIRQAVESLFGVGVLEVRTMSVKSKPKRRGYTSGKTRQWKKAIVQLREGESIEIFEGAQV